MSTDVLPALQADGFLRIVHIIGDSGRGIPPIIPVSRSSWWAGVKSRKYPVPVRHGGVTMWRVKDIRSLIARIDAEAVEHPYETD